MCLCHIHMGLREIGEVLLQYFETFGGSKTRKNDCFKILQQFCLVLLISERIHLQGGVIILLFENQGYLVAQR